jgi:HlyD family secretion protein
MLDPKEQQRKLAERFGDTTPSVDPVVGPDPEPGPELLPKMPLPPAVSRWWMVVPFCLGIWAGVALTQNSEQILQVTQTRPRRTVVTDRGDVRQTIRISGDTAAYNVAAVTTPRIRGRGLGGQMTLIKFADAGKWVTKGTVVAEFDTQTHLLKLDDQKAKVVQREANILKVKANQSIEVERDRVAASKAKFDLDKARLDLRTTAVKSAIVAARLKMAVEEAEVNLDVAQRELRLARRARRAELRSTEIRRDQELIDQKRAEMNIDRMVIQAPIDGMVVRMSNTSGNPPSEIDNGDQVRSGTHLMNIVDVTTMVLDATVNQADSQLMRTGLPAEVHLDAYPESLYPARIAAVGSIAGTATGGGGGRRGGRGGMSRSGGGSFLRSVPIEITLLAKDERVIPDLSASADVIIGMAKDVVRVPREAVRFDADQAWVEVAAENSDVFKRRNIEVGLVSDIFVEVVAGLEPGTAVAAQRLEARL